MQTTIDASGRLVVPAELRRRLGLRGGEVLDLEVRDGRLEVTVAPTTARLVAVEDGWVAEPDRVLPPLTAAQVRSTLEANRR